MAGENVPQIGTTPTTPAIGAPAPSTPIQDIPKQPFIFKRIQQRTIKQGSVITFNYNFWKHDPYPLLLCGGMWLDKRIVGINLHYLTFNYLRYLIKMYCDKQFTYRLIKNNNYISNAFRSYKPEGIRSLKLLDCDYLMQVLGLIRSFKPSEIEAIRQEVQKQLRRKLNPSAEDLAQEYATIIRPEGIISGRETIDDLRRIPKI